MRRRHRLQAFSLVEVVIAVGLFATVIVAVLGLLGPSIRGVRGVLDASVASRLADGVDAALRLHGFQSVVNDITALRPDPIPIVANEDGSRVVLESLANNAETALNPGIAPENRFFLIEVSELVSPGLDPNGGYVGLSIHVSWPYQIGTSGNYSVTERENRSSFVYSALLTP